MAAQHADPLGAVYDISLYFLLPGMMSLMSLLAADVSTIWRVSFVVAGVVVVLESILSLAKVRGHDSPARLVDLGNWASLVLDPAIVAIAIRRTIPEEIGIQLSPLEAEGILVGRHAARARSASRRRVVRDGRR